MQDVQHATRQRLADLPLFHRDERATDSWYIRLDQGRPTARESKAVNRTAAQRIGDVARQIGRPSWILE